MRVIFFLSLFDSLWLSIQMRKSKFKIKKKENLEEK
jgi:hypothetical protein